MGPQLCFAILTLPLLIIGVADEVGIEQWNELDDDYGFVYSNSEKGSKKVLVKCVVLNDKLLVDALREGDPEPAHIEIKYVLLFIYVSIFPSKLYLLIIFWNVLLLYLVLRTM